VTVTTGGKNGSSKGLDRPARIVVANDVELIVAGLRALLGPYQDRVEVIGTATGDPEILLEAVDSSADVLLIDAFSRSGAGLDAARAVLANDPSFKVAVFTETDDLSHLFAAIRLGVKGYLLKSISTDELVDSLVRVAAGETVIDPRMAVEAALLAARTTARSPWEGAHLGLSRREAEVLRLLASGSRVTAIAETLSVGRETVRTHLRQIYRKLGVNDRAAAVAVAWREGMGS
jgi:DNA-binding NarL/FixJ family response regulator